MASEPFPIPPVISPVIVAGRLHPASLLFRLWAMLRGLLIPIVILLIFGRGRGVPPFFLYILIGPIMVSVVRYFTFTYRIQGGELILKHGLLGRVERQIPLGRVQDVRLEQGVLHRLLRVADVQIDTAGGEGADASLSVLSQRNAEHLRATIFEQIALVQGKVPQLEGAPSASEVLRKVSVRELVLAGLTSNKLASLIALLVVAERLAGDFFSEEAYQKGIVSWAERIAHWEGPSGATWIWVAVGVTLLVLLGMVLSMIGTVAMFYGFTLERRGEDLHRSYGLLTRRSSSLPRRRIQLLMVEERWFRRLFRLVTLRVDTAAGKTEHEHKGGHDVLLPVIPRAAVDNLLPILLPQWESSDEPWQHVSRRAIYRATLKGAMGCLLAAGLLYWRQWTPYPWWPLLFLPIVYWLSVMSYRHLGYGYGKHYFRTRRGWLGRSTHIVPIRNVQVVVIHQTPLDRRNGVSTLIVDTAGQAYTGGGPRITNVITAEALDLGHQLAEQAAALRYRI